MKLHQRYVFLLTVFIVALVTVSVILTVTSQQQLYDTVKGVQGVIKRQLEMRQRPVPNKFVRQLTAEEFRENPLYKTGNPLIDQYTNNDLSAPGEFGRALVMPADLQDNATAALNTYHINVLASDMIHLNRMVPDSRFPGCRTKQYPHDLPPASIIIPFHDEWPSVLLRTVYSVVNRSPRHMLWEVVLVDDASTMDKLKGELDEYIASQFPVGLVRVLRLRERVGLIRARMEGIRLEPLLHQVQSDRQSVALGHLDYVQPDTFLYDWHKGYLTRYGFDWRLVFFETFFKPLTAGQDDTTPKPGALMVGAAFAVDREYFLEIGGYDEGMDVWGGENLELSWRIWMCGGSLIHVPCSKIGHIARVQPYSFPGGRREIEVHNYKRAVSLWMEDNHRRFIYDHYPDMENADAGDLSERVALKQRLGCKSFSWYLDNVWPELTVFDKDSTAWGAVRNPDTNLCLDNHSFLFTYPEPLYADSCHGKLATQGFALTTGGLLRSSLQCLVVKEETDGARVQLEDCIIGPADIWAHPQ
ncbi:hypothetical protein BaRGS_00007088, partial [Batillaria attramentaria]